MAGFTSYDDKVNETTSNGKVQIWNGAINSGPTPEAAGNWCFLGFAGGSPAAIAASGVAWANRTASEGIFFGNVSPDYRYLANCSISCTQVGTLMLLDLLGDIGSISVTTTGNKTVNSTALPRSMTSADLATIEPWVIVTTATSGAGAVAMSANSYTNEAGTTLRAGGTLTFPATATNQYWMAPLPLQAGDKGVQAISTVNVSAAASVAGVISVAMIRRIATIGIPLANVSRQVNFMDDINAIRRIYDGSVLCWAFLATAASTFSVPEFTIEAHYG